MNAEIKMKQATRFAGQKENVLSRRAHVKAEDFSVF